MAIAAGVPVPRVYLMDEPGINAFAAGLSPNDAVIGITRGALERLGRDELQGVIAHEFSHIFNGDMRMNIRLISVLHGILLLGLIGYYLLRVMRYVRPSRDREGGGLVAAVFALGLGLVIIGYVGFFFGQWIKAMVSRQREYLADASAVRFTRDREGIAGALKKIGGMRDGSLLRAPAAPEYSHAYFSQGVSGWLQSLFATHPPLETRIKRIEPGWDGKFKLSKPAPAKPPPEPKKAAAHGITRAQILAGSIAAGVLTANEVVERVGTVREQDMQLAREMLAMIPEPLKQAAAEPFGARAVIYGLLLPGRPDLDAAERSVLLQLADAAVIEQTVALQKQLRALPEQARLPLLELSMPALLSLSLAQYRQFRAVVKTLIAEDNKVDLKEWVIQRLLLQQLDQAFGLRKPPPARHAYLGAVKGEAEILLSLLAHAEHKQAAEARAAFDAGKDAIGAGAFRFRERAELTLEALDGAVDKLMQLKPVLKPRILEACAACVLFDQQVGIQARELLRTISSCLDSPMPPLPDGIA
jgi:hypothetical protein